MPVKTKGRATFGEDRGRLKAWQPNLAHVIASCETYLIHLNLLSHPVMQRPMCSPVTDLPQTEIRQKENDVRPKREDPHETPSHIHVKSRRISQMISGSRVTETKSVTIPPGITYLLIYLIQVPQSFLSAGNFVPLSCRKNEEDAIFQKKKSKQS